MTSKFVEIVLLVHRQGNLSHSDHALPCGGPPIVLISAI